MTESQIEAIANADAALQNVGLMTHTQTMSKLVTVNELNVVNGDAYIRVVECLKTAFYIADERAKSKDQECFGKLDAMREFVKGL